MDDQYYNNCIYWKNMVGWIRMAYTLTLNSISPTTAANTGNIGLRINFSLSGSGLAIPGFSLRLYNALSGGTLIKTLYYSDMYDPISGNSLLVDFIGVSPGTYYVELYYKVAGTPRRAITITGVGGVKNIKLNSSEVSSNKLNSLNVTKETHNGNTVYEG